MRFKASIITGASSFSGAGSISLSLFFSGAFETNLVAVESFEEIWQEWYVGYCAVAVDTELALFICEQDSEKVCAYVHNIVVAGSDSFNFAYSAAATAAGYVIKYAGCPLIWKSRLQTDTTEAKIQGPTTTHLIVPSKIVLGPCNGDISPLRL